MIEIAMQLIIHSGDAKSLAMEAIQKAKAKCFDEAHDLIEKADEAVLSAHHVQTKLLQREALGETVELSILLIHAQDHLMTSILAIDLAKEIIELYENK